jgi:flagellar basal body rod protein FlgB
MKVEMQKGVQNENEIEVQNEMLNMIQNEVEFEVKMTAGDLKKN